MFRYEMHLHCAEVSACAHSSAEEMVKAYYDVGYSGVVITDHFIFGNTAIDRRLPWEEKISTQFDLYTNALKLGKKLDFDVIIGLEHHYGSGKELLIYGDITKEKLLAHPEIAKMNVREFADFCHKNNWFVAQAHPYRDRGYIDMSVEPIPEILDGVEIYNYCNAPDENIKATEFCERLGLIPIAGSDTHSTGLVGMSGMAFEKRIKTGDQLAKALFKNKGRLIVEGEIV